MAGSDKKQGAHRHSVASAKPEQGQDCGNQPQALSYEDRLGQYIEHHSA